MAATDGVVLHFSLAAGLTSPRLLPTLHETNYLTGASRDVTFRRLLETSQFFFDACVTDLVATLIWPACRTCSR